MNELMILFQDDDLVAIRKPAGLLVHRTDLVPHESAAAMTILRDQIGQKVYPVHRLDRPTSGVLIFAKNSEAAQLLSEQFFFRKVDKKYLAVVRGTPPKTCVIDYPLKEELDKISDKKVRADKPAQDAITKIRTLATIELPVQVDRYPTSRYSLVEAQPQTGRKHQIRRHLRHLGHPIVGDVNHGVGKHNRFFAERYQTRRLLLTCTEISVDHPRTGQKLRIQSPLCEDFHKLLSELGWVYAHA